MTDFTDPSVTKPQPFSLFVHLSLYVPAGFNKRQENERWRSSQWWERQLQVRDAENKTGEREQERERRVETIQKKRNHLIFGSSL